MKIGKGKPKKAGWYWVEWDIYPAPFSLWSGVDGTEGKGMWYNNFTLYPPKPEHRWIYIGNKPKFPKQSNNKNTKASLAKSDNVTAPKGGRKHASKNTTRHRLFERA